MNNVSTFVDGQHVEEGLLRHLGDRCYTGGACQHCNYNVLAKRLCSKRKRFAVAGTLAVVCGLVDGLRAEALILVAQVAEKDGVKLVLGGYANENVGVVGEKCDGGVERVAVAVVGRRGCGSILREVVEIAQCCSCCVWRLSMK